MSFYYLLSILSEIKFSTLSPSGLILPNILYLPLHYFLKNIHSQFSYLYILLYLKILNIYLNLPGFFNV